MVGLHLLPSPGKYAKNQTTGVGTENTLLTLLNGRAIFLEEEKKRLRGTEKKNQRTSTISGFEVKAITLITWVGLLNQLTAFRAKSEVS